MSSDIPRTRFLGTEWAPLHLPLKRRLQTLAVIFFPSGFMMISMLTFLICVYFLIYTTYLQYLPLIYLTWFITDRNKCNAGGRVIKWSRRWCIWNYFRDYFPITLTKTAELDPDRNYVFGYHPHGIMCSGAFLNFTTEATGFGKKFPGLTSRIITLEGNFMWPFYRDLLMALGACASTRESINYLLKNEGVGNAVVIVIGGAAEALDAHPKNTTLTCKRRKGFVRLALMNGASLVPVFGFGENDVFEQVDNAPGTRLRFIQNKFSKFIGFSPPLFHGRGIFQYNFGFLPFRKPIHTIVGKPIHLEKVENPCAELINEVHEQYLKSLTDLFNEHKATYGHEDKNLVIK